MSYFSDVYDKLRYPRADKGLKGLRNAQLGAIHAIAAHATLNIKEANIIVMPTGSGKTAVLMMAPYVLAKQKALIVTPSIVVRGQISDDYRNLKTLKQIGVFDKGVRPPAVFELKKMYSEAQSEFVITADVVVGTPKVSLSLSESSDSGLFDYIVVDEAHHVPADTWQKILLNMRHASVLLVTATPFRLDKKEIRGEQVYSYPLSMAYRDGIFGEITYIPIEEAPEKDRLIAIEAERVFLNDKAQGFDHYVMVRTNTKKKAETLESIYKDNTDLKLKRIDSSTTYKSLERTIKQLRAKKIDGIICVNMLGEGFDFPNLKIAAIHEAHKSLASILQFIGRFTRTNAPNIGSAKFVAMNDESLAIENCRLFSTDAIWQDIIIGISDQKIFGEAANKNVTNEFVKAKGMPEPTVSLHDIKPNCHAKIFKVSSFLIDNEFPSICGVEDEIYRNYSNNTIVAIAKSKTNPIWLEIGQLCDVDNLLYIIHYQTETSLLFIYSQIRNETFYDEIAKAFAENAVKIPRNEMNRVLGKMENYEFYNTGMQSRYTENGESYRIYSGSNTAASIDETTGKMRSAGHAFCKATKDDIPATIGYSSGSKIWSSSYLKLPEYIEWCDEYGRKISDGNIVVKTNTNYDFLQLPSKIETYPSNIVFCSFSEKTYSSPPTILLKERQESSYILTDTLIKVLEPKTETCINLSLEIDDVVELLSCDIEAKYSSKTSLISVRDGKQLISLSDYFTSHPLQYKATDGTIIVGNEVFVGDPNLITYSDEHIYPIDWYSNGTNIRREYGKKSKLGSPIQSVLENLLSEDSSYSYIIHDHGTGEIADFISIIEEENELKVSLFHVKAMKAKQFNSSVNDIYEVLQQAIKSIIWLKNKSTLSQKIDDRRKSGKCVFKRGTHESLKKSLRKDRVFTSTIYVVQPSISKSVDMPEKLKEVIAAANFYINNSGRVKELLIWGSK